MNNVSFQTSDFVTISGDYYQSSSPIGRTILALHMMPATKESWQTFAEDAIQAGYDLLAIDLRGHGLSQKQGDKMLDYRQFNDEQHQRSIKDLQAAIEFLTSQGVDVANISLIGASIGANLALQYQALHPEIVASVLLSPGLDYRGIQLEVFARKISASQSVLLISGSDDSYSKQTIDQIEPLISGNSESIILPTDQHGTNLFIEHPKLVSRILSWING